MPVIAIGAALIADIGVGAAGFGAVLAGAASATVTLEAVAAVGATVSAIGAVTGDKTLSTVGMVLGGIGGIGALASSAGLFGADAASGASLFGDSSSISDIQPVTVTPQAGSLADGSDLGGSVGIGPAATVQEGQLPDIVNSLGGVAPTTPSPATAINQSIGAATGDATSLTPSALPTVDGTATGTAPSALNASSVGANAMAPSPVTISGGTAGAPVQAPANPGAAPPPAPGVPPSNPGIGQTITGADGNTYSFDGSKWVQQKSFFGTLMNSPGAQYGLIQAAGSFISGATSTLTPAQVAALDAQAAQNNAVAKTAQTQNTNISQPIPTASRTVASNVTGTPTGLINSPAPTNAVTGSVSA